MNKFKKAIYPFYRLIKEKDSVFKYRSILNYKISYLKKYKFTLLINTVQIANNTSSLFELVIAKYLAKRGMQVIILFDDRQLHHCDRLTNLEDRELKCRTCSLISNIMLFRSLNSGIQFVKYSDLLKVNSDLNKSLTYQADTNDINASLVRFIHDGTNPVNPTTLKFKKLTQDNALISYTISKQAHLKFKPDAVMSLHTIYSSWAPFTEYFKSKNTPVINYSKGQTSNTSYFFNYYRNRRVRDLSHGWLKFEKRNLNKVERKRVETFFAARFAEKTDFYKLLKKDLISPIRLPDSFNPANTFVVFPNVMWDNSVVGADTVFKDNLEWLLKTVEFFLNNSIYKLIIRAHPAENRYMMPANTTHEILLNEFPYIEQSANIYFIDSDSNISSYELFNHVKAGILYNGTIGLEMIYKKIPVIFGGSPIYGDQIQINYPKNLNQYHDFLVNPNLAVDFTKFSFEKFMNFLHYYFFDSEIEIPFMNKSIWRTIDTNKANEALAHGNPILDHIFNCILSKGEIDFSEWRKVL